MNKKESEEEPEGIKEIKERYKEEEREKKFYENLSEDEKKIYLKMKEEGDKAMWDLLSIMDKMREVDEVDEDGVKNEK